HRRAARPPCAARLRSSSQLGGCRRATRAAWPRNVARSLRQTPSSLSHPMRRVEHMFPSTLSELREAVCAAASGLQPERLERATSGKLSHDQAAAIADAVDADPTAEDRLNDDAETSSLGELRNACAKTKANADPDPSATERRIHAGRHVRRYRDAAGAEHLH